MRRLRQLPVARCAGLPERCGGQAQHSTGHNVLLLDLDGDGIARPARWPRPTAPVLTAPAQ
ncbi:MAG: hypothetical protein WKG07_25385 [Hymenobacter sp.]